MRVGVMRILFDHLSEFLFLSHNNLNDLIYTISIPDRFLERYTDYGRIISS